MIIVRSVSFLMLFFPFFLPLVLALSLFVVVVVVVVVVVAIPNMHDSQSTTLVRDLLTHDV